MKNRNSYLQTGFSLIELMISITLGLLVMTAVLALYLNISRSNAELANMNRQVESGRFTIQALEQELWHAGFWDTYMPPIPSLVPPTAMPNPCVGFSVWDTDYIANQYAIPVQGYDNGTGLPVECAGVVTSPQDDSDVIVIRHAGTCVAGSIGCEAYTTGKLYLQTQACTDTSTGKVNPNAVDLPILSIVDEIVYKRDCITPADRRKLNTSIFYIRNFSVTAGDGIPTLMRADLDQSGGSVVMQSAQPVIEGIQSIKFEYGRDADENGSADIFDNCSACLPADWANVVAVRIHVLARNIQPSTDYVDDKTYVLGPTAFGAFGDAFKRHAYSSYAQLINVSGRRDKP